MDWKLRAKLPRLFSSCWPPRPLGSELADPGEPMPGLEMVSVEVTKLARLNDDISRLRKDRAKLRVLVAKHKDGRFRDMDRVNTLLFQMVDDLSSQIVNLRRQVEGQGELRQHIAEQMRAATTVIVKAIDRMTEKLPSPPPPKPPVRRRKR